MGGHSAIAGGFVIAFSELFVTFAYKKVLGYLLPDEIAPSGLRFYRQTIKRRVICDLVIVLLIRRSNYSGKTLPNRSNRC